MRLHYHISCSYRVHKSSFCRIFSLQEIKQNNSRTSCNSSNYCTNFWGKQLKEKEKKGKVCVKRKFKRRKKITKLCLQKCRYKTSVIIKFYSRMTSGNFEKKNFSNSVNPAHTITCSHNWLFINRRIIQQLCLLVFFFLLNYEQFNIYFFSCFCLFHFFFSNNPFTLFHSPQNYF